MDPIKDALHAAALATMTAAEREHADTCANGQPGPGHIRRAAETVAAFLRARARTAPPTLPIEWMHECAAAVERAARDE